MTRFARLLLGVCAILALPQAAEAQALTTLRVASGLSGPLFVTSPPGDTQRLFIAEFNTGRIKILKNGSVLGTPFLDIGSLVTNNTNFGLLGLTFHPNYASNGYFYIQYVDNSFHPTVSRYQVSANPDIADSSSAQIVIVLDDFAIIDHQGGTVAFGPDGYLYVAFGDGQACDPGLRAQNDGDLHGKMLRLDVDSDTFPSDPNRNYAIPSSNPFVGAGDPLDEIWAKGFRNPFRFTFDRATGNLWEADVGQAQREEINFQPAGSAGGQNYGWRIKEGTACFNAVSGCTPNSTCPCAGCTNPIYEYDHSSGNCSISGGSVYRGSAIPSLAGTYFFGDWCSARIWSLKYNGSSVTDFTDRTAELDPGGGMQINQPVAIGEDGAGELYIVDMGGEIFKIVPFGSSIPALGGPGIAVLALLLAAGGAIAARRIRREAKA